MKSIAAIAMAAGLISCGSITIGNNGSKGLTGNGILTSKTIEAPQYTQVEVERGVVLRLVESPNNQITVTTDENVMPYVVITCQEGILKATIDPTVNYICQADITVEAPINPQITQLRASSAGEIELMVPLMTEELGIEASSAAEIKGALHGGKVMLNLSSSAEADLHLETMEKVGVHISSAAEAELRGSCRQLEALVTSAASLDAEELISTSCTANASSAGEIELYCTGLLVAEASSAGTIRYSGPCRVEEQKSSAGTIRKND